MNYNFTIEGPDELRGKVVGSANIGRASDYGLAEKRLVRSSESADGVELVLLRFNKEATVGELDGMRFRPKKVKLKEEKAVIGARSLPIKKTTKAKEQKIGTPKMFDSKREALDFLAEPGGNMKCVQGKVVYSDSLKASTISDWSEVVFEGKELTDFRDPDNRIGIISNSGQVDPETMSDFVEMFEYVFKRGLLHFLFQDYSYYLQVTQLSDKHIVSVATDGTIIMRT